MQSRIKRVEFIVCVTLLALFSGSVWGGNVHVAVASNFTAPMRDIATAFEKAFGHTLTLSAGASGKLYAQIVNGAPFHVLLSADDEIPARLERQQLAVSGSRYTYAIGVLALWSTMPGLVDDEGRVLWSNGYNRLAQANPKLAPYGAAATEVMEGLGLTATVRPKLIFGENIAQTHQFLLSGNAELGWVALSQVMKDGRVMSGSAWIVPEHLYRPIRQDAVLLSSGRHNSAATALLHFLRTPLAQRIIQTYGYRLAK